MRGGHLSREGFMACLGDKGREGQSDLLATAVFLNSFSLIYSVCKGAIFWVAFPELHYLSDYCMAFVFYPIGGVCYTD